MLKMFTACEIVIIVVICLLVFYVMMSFGKTKTTEDKQLAGGTYGSYLHLYNSYNYDSFLSMSESYMLKQTYKLNNPVCNPMDISTDFISDNYQSMAQTSDENNELKSVQKTMKYAMKVFTDYSPHSYDAMLDLIEICKKTTFAGIGMNMYRMNWVFPNNYSIVKYYPDNVNDKHEVGIYPCSQIHYKQRYLAPNVFMPKDIKNSSSVMYYRPCFERASNGIYIDFYQSHGAKESTFRAKHKLMQAIVKQIMKLGVSNKVFIFRFNVANEQIDIVKTDNLQVSLNYKTEDVVISQQSQVVDSFNVHNDYSRIANVAINHAITSSSDLNELDRIVSVNDRTENVCHFLNSAQRVPIVQTDKHYASDAYSEGLFVCNGPNKTNCFVAYNDRKFNPNETGNILSFINDFLAFCATHP